MTAEEFYKKEFGDKKIITKEWVIFLLKHFAKILEAEKNKKNNIANRLTKISARLIMNYPTPRKNERKDKYLERLDGFIKEKAYEIKELSKKIIA